MRPSVSSYNKGGGLCGIWNENPNDDFIIYDKMNRKKKLDDPNDETCLIRLGLYWR